MSPKNMIGTGVVVTAVVIFAFPLTALFEFLNWMILLTLAGFGLGGLMIILFGIRGELLDAQRAGDRHVQKLEELVEKAEDIHERIDQRAGKMESIETKSLENFNASTNKFNACVNQLAEVLQNAQERMISDEEARLIREAVNGFRERDTDRMIDAIESIHKERK